MCNGQNGTPDLINRFIVGAGDEYVIGNNGGEKEVVLTTEQMPRHWYSVKGYAGIYQENADNHNAHIIANTRSNSSGKTTYAGGDAEGNTVAHENRPPYYALAYIMKVR